VKILSSIVDEIEDRILGLNDKVDILEYLDRRKKKEVLMEHVKSLGHY
jgi:hypothetical protein